MRYRIGDLQIFATPSASEIFRFPCLSQVEFEFPTAVRTLLFIHCGEVRTTSDCGKGYFELVGRLYKTDRPKETGEDHTGKLYVYVHGFPHATWFETIVEQLEGYSDGSFDVIASDGKRTKVYPER